jgi:hypothetical protein
MSIELMLEIDDSINKNKLVDSLIFAGASDFSDDSSGFDCFFEKTKISVYVDEKSNPSWKERRARDEFITENVNFPATLKVGFRVIFRFPRNEHAESNGQIKNVLLFLEENTKANFVLSFQYEKVIAIRHNSSLQFIYAFE